MNPRRLLSPLRWMAFGLTVVVLSAISVEAFTRGAIILGSIGTALLFLYLALRLYVVIALTRAKRRPLTSPVEPFVFSQQESRMRLVAMTFAGTFAAFAVLAFVAGFVVPGEFSIVCWALAGCFVLVSGLMIASWRVGLRRRAAIREPQA